MSPFDSRSPGPGRMFPESAAQTTDTMPESETAVRTLKASQSAKLAFVAAGIPNPSPALVNMVADYVRRRTLGIPPGQIAAMGPGSGELAANAVAGVNMAMGALSDEQRAAAREGNAPSPDDIARIHAALNLPDLGLHPGHRANGQRDSGPASGARFDRVESAVYPGSPNQWTTARGMIYMRTFAIRHGLNWATDVPKILHMGPQAVKALADVQLKKESYDRLTNGAAFAPKDVVTLA